MGILIIGIIVFIAIVAGRTYFKGLHAKQQLMKAVADEELGKLTAIAMEKVFWCKSCFSALNNKQDICTNCGKTLINYTFSDYINTSVYTKPIADNRGQLVSCILFIESSALLYVREEVKSNNPCLLIQVTCYGYKEKPSICAVWGGTYSVEIPKPINEELFSKVKELYDFTEMVGVTDHLFAANDNESKANRQETEKQQDVKGEAPADDFIDLGDKNQRSPKTAPKGTQQDRWFRPCGRRKYRHKKRKGGIVMAYRKGYLGNFCFGSAFCVCTHQKLLESKQT